MKSLGYVHTPIAEHHRWEPISRRSISTGRGTFNRTTRLMLHQMRWRKPPRQVGVSIFAWVVSLLVHAVVLVMLLLVRPPAPYAPPPRGDGNAIVVRFIAARPEPPPAPPVPQQPRSGKTLKPVHRAARNMASTAPRKAPVAKPARVRPENTVKLAVTPAPPPAVAAPVVHPPLPGVKREPVGTPAPQAPAIALPPPEKLVMEPSRMALPAPRVQVTQMAPVQARAPSPSDLPIALAPARPELAVPKIRIRVDTAGPVPTQPITPVKAVPAPSPRIEVGSARPQQDIRARAPERVQVRTNPGSRGVQVPVVAVNPNPDLPEVPEAPLQSPRVDIRPAAPMASVPGAQQVAPEQPDIAVRIPPPEVAVPRMKLSASLPDARSWARSHDDRFSKAATQPGAGTAAAHPPGRGRPDGVPAFIERLPEGNSNVMTRQFKGLHYKPTIFDQYWAPDNQDLLTSWLQNLVDATSYHTTIDMGHGVRIHCGGWLLGFGCGGDAPDPASAKSNDRRLNMAPARPLVPGLGASSAPPAQPVRLPQSSAQSVECETARVSGAPPPPGCGPASPAQSADPWKH